MAPLRQRMITAMQMHGYSPRTHESDLAAVRALAKHTHRSPDSLSHDDLRRYFQYLVTERQLACDGGGGWILWVDEVALG